MHESRWCPCTPSLSSATTLATLDEKVPTNTRDAANISKSANTVTNPEYSWEKGGDTRQARVMEAIGHTLYGGSFCPERACRGPVTGETIYPSRFGSSSPKKNRSDPDAAARPSMHAVGKS